MSLLHCGIERNKLNVMKLLVVCKPQGKVFPVKVNKQSDPIDKMKSWQMLGNTKFLQPLSVLLHAKPVL